MSEISVSLQFGQYQGTTLTSNHFGAGMLFHTDEVYDDSDFSRVIEHLDIQLIRYPGGTISEQFFDLQNPNDTYVENVLDIINSSNRVDTRTVLPLSDYIEYMNKISGTPTIVLPTFRYFDQRERELSRDGRQQIENFISKLVSGEYGLIRNGILEIGNEWYQSNFNWTVGEYGALQEEIAATIATTMELLNVRDQFTILAQTGQNEDQHRILASYFEGPSADSIDGVITHIYGTNSSGNPLRIGSGAGNRLDDIRSEWATVLGEDFLLAVTEWNVGESGENSTLINGIMRFAPLLRLFAEMVSSDVDIAHIWSTQTRGPAGLSDREGSGSSLSPTGYFFDLLRDGTIDTQLVENEDSFYLRDENGGVVGYTYSFVGSNHTSVYFASGVDDALTIDVDLAPFWQDGAFLYLTVLSGAPGDIGTHYWSDASSSFITEVLPESRNGSVSFSLEVASYSLIQLHISWDTGVTIAADEYNVIDDLLNGTSLADNLSGALGDDTIVGNDGNDTLSGGQGDDDISAGNGRDSVEGGLGNDLIDGGNWHDTIFGGEGDDTIIGGNGNDQLFGNTGFDVIDGGAGDDVVNSGSGSGILDGGSGLDTLDFSGLEIEISVWGSERLIETGFDGGVFSLVEYRNFEAIRGTEHADRFQVVENDVDFYGMSGDDFFDFRSGDNVHIDMGAGNDKAFVSGNGEAEIVGGAGNDHFFVLGSGLELIGGSGNDVFYLNSRTGNTLHFNHGDGHDQIYGMDISRNELVIDVERAQVSIINIEDSGTLISLGDESSLMLHQVFFQGELDNILFL